MGRDTEQYNKDNNEQYKPCFNYSNVRGQRGTPKDKPSKLEKEAENAKN